MTTLDFIVFGIYMLLVLGVGWYFYRKNTDADDYYVGGRNMGAGHIGLSVVATDVGGGFSIGLGGLGFLMGMSGSWMLFTGLIGAWLSAVLLIPKIFKTKNHRALSSFPGFLKSHYGKHVAWYAGLISGIGYLGFTASQFLAGAKLASGTFPEIDQNTALLVMGLGAVLYTVLGGMKAVIYTDTFQWIILMGGLIGIGIPLGYLAVGGWDGLQQHLPASHFSLGNLGWKQAINWAFTIIPIWFVGMTLYQRIFACKDEKTAKKAWFLAGLFEYPIMAFMGVLLGMFARAGADQGMFAADGFASAAALGDEEVALPMFLRTILPAGLTGLMLSAYFSAIMSTADSCLMAASGNFVTDLTGIGKGSAKSVIRWSQAITLITGILAILLALTVDQVLDLMLGSYGIMVASMLVPVLALLTGIKLSRRGALSTMLAGALVTGAFMLAEGMADQELLWGFKPLIAGILASMAVALMDVMMRQNSKA